MSKWNQSRKQIIEQVLKMYQDFIDMNCAQFENGFADDAKVSYEKAQVCIQFIRILSERKGPQPDVITNGENEDASDDKQRAKDSLRKLARKHPLQGDLIKQGYMNEWLASGMSKVDVEELVNGIDFESIAWFLEMTDEH